MTGRASDYISWIRNVKRYSERTCAIYTDILSRFCEFSGSDIPNVQSIRGWEKELLDNVKASPRTVNQHLSVISGYCNFLCRHGELDGNPAKLVSRPKQTKALPAFIRDESVQAFFDSNKGVLEFGSPEAAMRYAIVSTLLSTGLRRAELIAIDERDVDFSRRVIHVRHAKGSKMRDVPLTETLAAELRTLLERKGSGPNGDAPLFTTPKGGRLYPMFVERVVTEAFGRSPHTLRHTIATDLLRGGADLEAIRQMLGHSSLAATQVYTHNSIEHLREVYSAAHPRARKK